MFQDRLKNIKERLIKEKLDGVLISSVSNITYLTGYANFSQQEREAYLLIGQDFQYIITDGRYTEAVTREAPHFKIFERNHQTPVENLFKDLKNQIKILGIEEDDLTVAEHKLLLKHFKKTKYFNINTYRSIKTADEINTIEQAAKLADKAFDYILKKIKPGIAEKELAFEIEFYIKKHQADISFPSIVAFGKNSSVPHHQTGNTVLDRKQGQFILVDFGVKLDNYCSDMTRTVFLGKPTDKQKKIYQVVLAAQQKAVDFINLAMKSGKKLMAVDVDKVARSYIISKGYPTIPHSLGHGIGLEVHESPHLSPKSREFLKAGMAFSIEPGIYLESLGGVRIEDLFVLENSQLRQLTLSPKKIISVKM